SHSANGVGAAGLVSRSWVHLPLSRPELDPQAQEMADPGDRFAQAHFTLALLPVEKADGDLPDHRAALGRPVERFDEERVAGGADALPGNRFQDLAAIEPKAGRAVLDGDTEERAHEAVGGGAQALP